MAKTPRIAHRSSSTDTRRELVAAAALVGTVAVGGTLARGRRASSRRDSERAFRLYEDESTPDGIRRIARGQLDQSHDELADGPKRRFATAVHDTRKRFKRLRATVRLVRSSSATPSRRSSWRIARDNGGCAIPSRCAARPKCSSSATATKYRSSRVSIPPRYRRAATRGAG